MDADDGDDAFQYCTLKSPDLVPKLLSATLFVVCDDAGDGAEDDEEEEEEEEGRIALYCSYSLRH